MRAIIGALAFVVLAGPVDTGDGVELGGVFGSARASAIDLSATTIELNLEIEADSEAVVVSHLIEPGGQQETLPLVSRSSGVFGIRTEVRKVDYVVVFEIVGGLSAQSRPLRLTELGLEPALLGILPGSSTNPGEVTTATKQWGWAGLSLAATALAVLAFWALPDRRHAEGIPPAIEESNPHR